MGMRHVRGLAHAGRDANVQTWIHEIEERVRVLSLTDKEKPEDPVAVASRCAFRGQTIYAPSQRGPRRKITDRGRNPRGNHIVPFQTGREVLALPVRSLRLSVSVIGTRSGVGSKGR